MALSVSTLTVSELRSRVALVPSGFAVPFRKQLIRSAYASPRSVRRNIPIRSSSSPSFTRFAPTPSSPLSSWESRLAASFRRLVLALGSRGSSQVHSVSPEFAWLPVSRPRTRGFEQFVHRGRMASHFYVVFVFSIEHEAGGEKYAQASAF